MDNVYGAIWDMDGVLVDTGEFHFQSWRETLALYGVPFNEAQFRQTFGMNNTTIIKLLLGTDTAQETIERVGDEKEVLFRTLINGKIRPLPGVMQLLAALQAAGFRQAIASSAPQANIDALVDALDLRPYFQAIVSAANLPGKPNPAVFLQAAAGLDLPPQRCLVFEDAIAGVAGAKNAGMRCIAVTTTNQATALSQADRVVETLEIITPAILRQTILGDS